MCQAGWWWRVSYQGCLNVNLEWMTNLWWRNRKVERQNPLLTHKRSKFRHVVCVVCMPGSEVIRVQWLYCPSDLKSSDPAFKSCAKHQLRLFLLVKLQAQVVWSMASANHLYQRNMPEDCAFKEPTGLFLSFEMVNNTFFFKGVIEWSTCSSFFGVIILIHVFLFSEIQQANQELQLTIARSIRWVNCGVLCT